MQNPNLPDFNTRLPIEHCTKQEIISYFEADGWSLVEDNHNKYYDLIMNNGEADFKIELKEDFMCKLTGNIALEYECRGKDSGINVTDADLYVYKIHTNSGVVYHVAFVSEIKRFINEGDFFRSVVGGDYGSNTKMYLLKIDIYMSLGVILYDERPGD